MPHSRRRPVLDLSDNERRQLVEINRSVIEPSDRKAEQRKDRTQILLAYAAGENISSIARRLGFSRTKVQRSIDRALEKGIIASLEDRHRRGRPPRITQEAQAWVITLACQQPKEFGYEGELWSMDLLARHARAHCRRHGYPSLEKLSTGTVSQILFQGKPSFRLYVETRR